MGHREDRRDLGADRSNRLAFKQQVAPCNVGKPLYHCIVRNREEIPRSEGVPDQSELLPVLLESISRDGRELGNAW